MIKYMRGLIGHRGLRLAAAGLALLVVPVLAGAAGESPREVFARSTHRCVDLANELPEGWNSTGSAVKPPLPR
ncbi:hypothetical protein [Streptomyces sp. NPDC101166]|uniref:hypothetical protein n=1 Tax=Streptomyces sp. NPDC101166 TaxID=3366120 RepID=UPI00381CAF16